MAGPGGGPPRRSHTKSRKGCELCKRRHIRCDENFPQCRNCTKHKMRCPYNDSPPAEERSASPDKPDLLWTPEIDRGLKPWIETSVFPFPALNIRPTPDPLSLTLVEARLIYHVAEICDRLNAIGCSEFTLWTRQIPTIIQIGATHRYVLDALFAFSAMNISSQTSCPIVGNIVYEYRGTALKGLHKAIGSFSMETSDAVLAASLVLSWQANDWQSWRDHMSGTLSVIDAINKSPWRENSQFSDFIAECSTFPTTLPSPRPGHKPKQRSKEDLDALERTFAECQAVEGQLKRMGENTKEFTNLVNFLKGIRRACNGLTVEQQFDHLSPLRGWLLWAPVDYLQQTEGSPSALLTIAYFYTVALVMERLFPEVGAAYFGSLTMAPLDAIYQRLGGIIPRTFEEQTMMSGIMQSMRFPVTVLDEFRSRMGLPQPAVADWAPTFDQSQFYWSTEQEDSLSFEMPPNSQAMEMPTTSGFPPYGNQPAFSYSMENISPENLTLIPGDSGPNSAISPLQLSPFSTTHHLNIPSPSYGSHSPTSSSYEDFDGASVGIHSDNGDFGTFDMNSFTGSNTMLGGPSNFGIGFVPQSQALWIS
ncbi:hypothetical protein GE09DRAFT_1243347 [Coniochaeta sp. 2T2.1]|nr:hypothetical protein GE09DRAFT_1243347 [Coniochaeta sp. 2T2.1]